jgi:nicotinate-nucleotide pyrophosphorylase (carboxylating)
MDYTDLAKNPQVREIIRLALAEDMTGDDLTSRSVIPAGLSAAAVLTAKARGVLAGLPIFAAVFGEVDKSLRVERFIVDGSRVKPGDIIARVSGNARSLLGAERVALNFLCHLSGVATGTAVYVERLAGSAAVITDTRKTMPGMRLLEKYAVHCGGGTNHRLNLADGILIKDNHLAALAGCRSLRDVVGQARQAAPAGTVVEVEVNSLAQAEEAVAGGADIVLLDNMSAWEMAEVVKQLAERAIFEASGGIDLSTVAAVAASGVNRISVGALTHSSRVLDFSLEMETQDKPQALQNPQ